MPGFWRNTLLGVLFFLLFFAAGFWWYKKANVSEFSLIPEEALAIGKFENLQKFAQMFSGPEHSLSFLLTQKIGFFSAQKNPLFHQLRQTDFTASLHLTSRQDYEFLFFFPYSDTLAKVFDHFSDKIGEERQLFGEKIYENQNYTLAVFDEAYLVLSRSSILVEDAIRQKISGLPAFYAPASFPERCAQNAASHDLFFNFDRLAALAEVLFEKPPVHFYFAKGIWGGKKTAGGWVGKYLEGAEGRQPPKNSRLPALLPRRAAWVNYQLFAHGSEMLKFFSAEKEKNREKDFKQLKRNYNFDVSDFSHYLSGEIALATSLRADENLSTLLVLGLQDTASACRMLSSLPQKQQDYFVDTFSDTPKTSLFLLRVPLLRALLGKAAVAFGDKSYYTILGNYLIFFTDFAAAENFFFDLAAEKTVEKFSRYAHLRPVFAHTSAYNFGDAAACAQILLNSLKPNHRKVKQGTAKPGLRKGTYFSAYFLGKDSTHFSFFSENADSAKIRLGLYLKKTIPFRYTLNKPVVLLRNYEKGHWDFLVRDRANYLTLTAEDGKKRWMLPVSALPDTEIWSVNRLLSRQKSYLFAINHRIYLINAKGGVVRNFPLTLPSRKKITQLSVLLFQDVKGYRIAAADRSGDVFMFSKYGTPLPAWYPKRFGSGLLAPLKHLRIAKKDYLLVLTKNGLCHCLTPEGKSHKGFPVNLKIPPGNHYNLQIGQKPADCRLTLLTKQGEKIVLNLLGEIVERTWLQKKSEAATYEMLPNQASGSAKNDWLLAQYKAEELHIFDRQNKHLMRKNMKSADRPLLQYFDFGTRGAVVALTNQRKGGSQLFDKNGNEIGKIPKNRFALSISSEKNSILKVYQVESNKLKIYKLKL